MENLEAMRGRHGTGGPLRWPLLGWCWEGKSRIVQPMAVRRLTERSYLILPGLYAKNPELKFSQAVLSVFVVALLTAGYSFTALLCFACRNDEFQAESVFVYVVHVKHRRHC